MRVFFEVISDGNQYFSLKMECEKLASEKTEMQRHYVMVNIRLNVLRMGSVICCEKAAIGRQHLLDFALSSKLV